MESFPPYNQIDHPAMPKSKLNSLLLILMATFFASGIALILLKQIDAYHREQIYLAEQATLPVHKPAKADNEKTEEINVKDWKTYNNEQFGFLFDYPPTQNLTEKNNLITTTFPEEVIEPGVNDSLALEISFDSSKKYKDLAQFLGQWEYKDSAKAGLWDVEEIGYKTINGIKFYNYTWTHQGQGEVYLAVYNSGLLKITLSSRETQKPLGSYKNYPAAKKIIETLKSVEKIDTSSWQTYRNEKYGFEFKCPTNWEYSGVNDDRPNDAPTAFFCSLGKSRIGILPVNGFGYGTPLEEPKVLREKFAGKDAQKISWDQWDKDNPKYRYMIYEIIEPVDNWLVCPAEEGKSCNRIDILVLSEDYSIAQEILSTFKFTN